MVPEELVAPITAGQHTDATESERRQMKKRAFVLNKKLATVVNRKQLDVLKTSLPPKRDFVICLKMTPFQRFMYMTLLNNLYSKNDGKIISAITGYQALLTVWNHPGNTVLYAKERHDESIADGKKKAGRRQGSYQ